MSGISDTVVSRYFQHWSQTNEERIEVLNDAIKAAGINATFSQHEENGKNVGSYAIETDEDGERVTMFRKELDACFPLGRFEDESTAVEKLIAKYASKQDTYFKAD